MSLYKKVEFKNILKIKEEDEKSTEIFECLFKNNNLIIERIISPNTSNKNSEWYNQDWDEWVLLIEGSAEIEFENIEFISLKKGDYFFIPKNTKHRVIKTQSESKTIWLAIHIDK